MRLAFSIVWGGDHLVDDSRSGVPFLERNGGKNVDERNGVYAI